MFVVVESRLRYHAQNDLRCDPITMCSKLRHRYIDDVFNNATAWMDNEMSHDLILVLMARLSRCGSSVHVTNARRN